VTAELQTPDDFDTVPLFSKKNNYVLMMEHVHYWQCKYQNPKQWNVRNT